MPLLIIAVVFTLVGSALCSVIEAMLLSTTTGEIEALKARAPRAGAALSQCRDRLDESISAILTFNTIANTLGSFLCGMLADRLFFDWRYAFAVGMTVGLLIFGEILPKNIGVLHRKRLHPILVWALVAMRAATRPLLWAMRPLIKKFLGPKLHDVGDTTQEIAFLAVREAQQGNLTLQESKLIANALKLDEVRIHDIMTPRIVVTTLEKSRTIGQVFRELPNIPFARLPVYDGRVDNIVGIARRRDLLKAKAADQDNVTVASLMHPVLFVPDTATAATTLQQFLKNHQQIAVVVDEYGSLAGVVSMEDIFEHLLGAEFFEKDDVAVDMREFARRPRPPVQPPLSVVPPPPADDSSRKTG
ncbi:MAG TPA: CNNM domain-containing protein [Opitutales bacterium]|nr:CNNM domain-containing protein [Opitutales bacterium]